MKLMLTLLLTADEMVLQRHLLAINNKKAYD